MSSLNAGQSVADGTVSRFHLSTINSWYENEFAEGLGEVDVDEHRYRRTVCFFGRIGLENHLGESSEPCTTSGNATESKENEKNEDTDQRSGRVAFSSLRDGDSTGDSYNPNQFRQLSGEQSEEPQAEDPQASVWDAFEIKDSFKFAQGILSGLQKGVQNDIDSVKGVGKSISDAWNYFWNTSREQIAADLAYVSAEVAILTLQADAIITTFKDAWNGDEEAKDKVEQYYAVAIEIAQAMGEHFANLTDTEKGELVGLLIWELAKTGVTAAATAGAGVAATSLLQSASFASKIKKLGKLGDVLKGALEKLRKIETRKNGLNGSGDQHDRMADRRLYDRMKKAFEKNGGDIWDDDQAAQHLFDNYGPGIMGASEDLGDIVLHPNASRSIVFEEFIHNTQRLKGRYGKWVKEFGDAKAKILAEIEAMQRLLKNGKKWEIPENELSHIRERLQGYLADLERLKN